MEGRHAVKELLLAGTRTVRQVVIAGDQDSAPILDDIIDLADEAGVDIRELSRGRFEQMAATDAPQGVVAFAAPLREYALEELIADLAAGGTPDRSDGLYRSAGIDPATSRPSSDLFDDSETEGPRADGPAEEDSGDDREHGSEGDAGELSDPDTDPAVLPAPAAAPPTATATGESSQVLLLVVDGVTDPGNLGAILRTAECAGVTGVVLPRHRAARITPTVAKRAAGAIEHLRFAPVSGIPTALATIAELGVWSVGLDVTADQTIWDLPIADAPLALVLGAEGRGLSRLVRQRCDVTARIPVSGRLDSLNVSGATAVALFEVLRRRTDG